LPALPGIKVTVHQLGELIALYPVQLGGRDFFLILEMLFYNANVKRRRNKDSKFNRLTSRLF
jgi:hypothetical protein